MSKCSWMAHTGEGLYYPVMVFHAPKKEYPNAPPIKSYLPILCCEVCKREAKIESFLSDEGWDQIKYAIEKQGRVVPDRLLTTVEFISMEDAPKQNLVDFKL